MLEIDLWTILWTGINLVVLYLLMRRFLFGPVTAMMEAREKVIEDGLNRAEQAKKAAQAQKAEQEAQLLQVRLQSEKLVEQARTRGQREYEQLMERARAEAKQIRQTAQMEAEAQQRTAMEEVRQQVADLALLAAAKVSGQKSDSQQDRAMLEEFFQEVRENP